MAEEVKTAAAEGESGSKNFIDAFIEEDIAEGGRFQGQQVHTRFPPEPNGYLHIGHCKALTIDFGTAERFGGLCNLRMDDTNPTKEDVEFVDAIKEDIHWLGFDWGSNQTHERCSTFNKLSFNFLVNTTFFCFYSSITGRSRLSCRSSLFCLFRCRSILSLSKLS